MAGKNKGGVSKNQRDVTKPAKSQASKPTKTVEFAPAGVFPVPGGTITLDGKGGSRYEGDPFRPIRLKNKLICHADDHDANGKVRIKSK